jgi:hypothetical protein
MATFAPATDKLNLMNARLTATVLDHGSLAANSGLADAPIADTLVLSLFSVVYELAVTLLRVRSRLLAAFAR